MTNDESVAEFADLFSALDDISRGAAVILLRAVAAGRRDELDAVLGRYEPGTPEWMIAIQVFGGE